ncbi:hypothetical protein [Microbacterium sp. BK668]|uniref:TRAP transporter substrate-binding protein n=1 Tax=Microbacterium sp. BK668 TaxID=2512118 RepID=UPI001062112A|nr:hypothetical protein [Microbacterium sp. BK668]TDN91342.1 TRAP-type C4-dicarboxylate transport system substrate-binding protein [Microbacterium sp. BK668]
MNRTPQLALAMTVVAVAGLGLTACAGPAAEPLQPTTLRMLHIDGGAELDPGVDWFAEAVSEESDGVVTIEVVRSCCEDRPTIEEELVAKVAAGEAELGWVGTRVFEGLGVDALLPLTAPFLLDGYAQQQAILGSEEAEAALAAVDAAGVTGIALMPGAVRRPLAAQSAIVGPDDWSGQVVASFHSGQNARSFELLDASPVDVSFEERDTGIFEGSIAVLENSLVMQDSDREETLPYATANVGLWPRVSALVASPDGVAAGDERVRRILRTAATAVLARAGELAALDQSAAESSCASGARLAEASAADLEALRARVAPIWEELAASASTRDLFETARSVHEATPAETVAVPAGCSGTASTDAGGSADPGDLSVLNGRYRTPEYTVEGLLAAGLTPTDARNAAGFFTLVFDDGAFELIADHASGEVFGCVGSYAVEGTRVVVDYLPGGDCGPGGEFFSATYAVDADALTLTAMEGLESDVYLFSSSPLTRVG